MTVYINIVSGNRIHIPHAAPTFNAGLMTANTGSRGGCTASPGLAILLLSYTAYRECISMMLSTLLSMENHDEVDTRSSLKVGKE